MNLKTDKQALRELQYGKPLAAVLRDTLEKFRGQAYQINRAALDMNVSVGTIYNWCADYGIDLDEFRGSLPDPVEANAGVN